MKKFLFLLSISTLTLHSFERIKDPLSYLPKFGIYDSQKYPLIPTYNAFLLPINVIIEAAPIELIKAILWGKGIKIKGKNPITLKADFINRINPKEIISAISINATNRNPDFIDKFIYNVVFHSLILNQRNKPDFFNIKEFMGIFTLPSGAISAAKEDSIAVNKLSKEIINYHEGPAFSPNNAKFKIDKSRKVVAFWTAAILDDIKKISITFDLIFLDKNIDIDLLRNPKDKFSIIASLYQLKEQYNGKDAQALQEAINLLNIEELPHDQVIFIYQQAVGPAEEEPGPAPQQKPARQKEISVKQAAKSVRDVIIECLELT